MKKNVVILCAFLFANIVLHKNAQIVSAVCTLDQGDKQFSAEVSIIDTGTNAPLPPLEDCPRPGRNPPGTYTVWCDTLNESLSAESTFEPICTATSEPTPTEEATDNKFNMPSDPGYRLVKYTRNKSQDATQVQDCLLCLIGQRFVSAVRMIASFGACRGAGNACVDVFDETIKANQYKYMYGKGIDDKGSALFSITHQDLFSWPKEEDPDQHLRYQYVGCYKAPDNPIERFQTVIRKAVNSLVTVTVNNQPHIQVGMGGNLVGAAITGAYEPLTKFDLNTPNEVSEVYTKSGENNILKKDFEKFFIDCEEDFTNEDVSGREEPVSGDISGGSVLPVEATALQAIDFASNFRNGSIWCISSLANFNTCRAAVLGVDLESGIFAISPGSVFQDALGEGPQDPTQLPPTVKQETAAMIASIKPFGYWGANIPISFMENKPDYMNASGEVASNVDVIIEASPGEPAQGAKKIIYDAANTMEVLWNYSHQCAPLPLIFQEQWRIDKNCVPVFEPTSNWATGIGDIGPAPPTRGSVSGCPRRPDVVCRNDFIQDIIVKTTEKWSIPQCVLEGIGKIEGAYHWGPEDQRPDNACWPNSSGAAGPFQVTVGRDTPDPPGICRSGRCVNALKYIDDTPDQQACMAQDNADWAVMVLNWKSPYRLGGGCGEGTPKLTRAPWNTQRGAVWHAACGYYGSARYEPGLRMSYPDFVVAHCQNFPNGMYRP